MFFFFFWFEVGGGWGAQGCAGSRKRKREEWGVFIQKLVLVNSRKVFLSPSLRY